MGTRSRIIIVRPKSQSIYLWQPYDGYFKGGVGEELCVQLRILLKKYTSQELREMSEQIKQGNEIFVNTEMLSDIFENEFSVQFDECDDIEYEYKVDLINEILTVTNKGGRKSMIKVFTFHDIIHG